MGLINSPLHPPPITGTEYHRLGLEVCTSRPHVTCPVTAHFKSTQAGSAHARSSKHHLAAQAAQAGYTYKGGSYCLAAFDKFWCCPCAVCLPRDAFESHVKSDQHRQRARGWKENSNDRLGVRSCALLPPPPGVPLPPVLYRWLWLTCQQHAMQGSGRAGKRPRTEEQSPVSLSPTPSPRPEDLHPHAPLRTTVLLFSLGASPVEVAPPRVLGEKASVGSGTHDSPSSMGSSQRCSEPSERRLESLLPDIGSIRRCCAATGHEGCGGGCPADDQHAIYCRGMSCTISALLVASTAIRGGQALTDARVVIATSISRNRPLLLETPVLLLLLLLPALTLGTPVTTDPLMRETAPERQARLLRSHRRYR